jgi:hypothetical protein
VLRPFTASGDGTGIIHGVTGALRLPMTLVAPTQLPRVTRAFDQNNAAELL